MKLFIFARSEVLAFLQNVSGTQVEFTYKMFVPERNLVGSTPSTDGTCHSSDLVPVIEVGSDRTRSIDSLA